MKKTTLMFAMLLLVVGSSNTRAGMHPQFGVKAGIALADQTWKYSNFLGTVARDTRTGLVVGAFADLSLGPILHLQPEALYVQKGDAVEVPITSPSFPDPVGTRTLRDRIDYLSLVAPVKLQATRGLLGFYLIGGPRLDLKLSTRSDIDGPDINAILDSYKSSVAGLTVGAGVQRSFGTFGPVLLEARYDYDLSDAAKHVGSEATLVIDNKEFSILVGLIF